MHYRVTLSNAYLQKRVVLEFELRDQDLLEVALEAIRIAPVFSINETIVTVEQVSETTRYCFRNGSLVKE